RYRRHARRQQRRAREVLGGHVRGSWLRRAVWRGTAADWNGRRQASAENDRRQQRQQAREETDRAPLRDFPREISAEPASTARLARSGSARAVGWPQGNRCHIGQGRRAEWPAEGGGRR